MAVDKSTAVKISAYYSGWLDAKGFAESTDKNQVYRQSHYMQPDRQMGFYVIGKGDKDLPLDLLTDVDYVADLALVLTPDAINGGVLKTIQKIEDNRDSSEGEHVFEIQVVGEVGRDSSTGEVKYVCANFSSTKALAEAHTRKTIKTILVHYERTAVTLRQVKE